jgi:hypothetical protein
MKELEKQGFVAVAPPKRGRPPKKKQEEREQKPLWIPRQCGSVTRYHRDGQGGYNMRHVMEPDVPGKPGRRKWTLFAGDRRIWDVQPHGLLSVAIEAAEAWIAGR